MDQVVNRDSYESMANVANDALELIQWLQLIINEGLRYNDVDLKWLLAQMDLRIDDLYPGLTEKYQDVTLDAEEE